MTSAIIRITCVVSSPPTTSVTGLQSAVKMLAEVWGGQTEMDEANLRVLSPTLQLVKPFLRPN